MAAVDYSIAIKPIQKELIETLVKILDRDGLEEVDRQGLELVISKYSSAILERVAVLLLV